MLERVIAGVLLAGTNVHFSGNTGGVIATNRSGVNQPLTLAVQRRVMRGLRRQNAQRITSVVGASPNFNTSPVPPCFIGVAHTDLEQDIREMPGFIPTEKYGSYKPMDGEVGSVEGVRYILTTVLEPWLDEGAAPVAGASVESNEGACADVYPVLYFAKTLTGRFPLPRRAGTAASPVTPDGAQSQRAARRRSVGTAREHQLEGVSGRRDPLRHVHGARGMRGHQILGSARHG